MADISYMNTMGLTTKTDGYFEIIKWAGLSILLLISVLTLNHLHQQQLLKLTASSNLLNQKSFLVSKMHDEMLLISRIQLNIFHASNQQQVNQNLQQLSELVSGHLIHYHQLKSIADESDRDLLMQFRLGFDKWHNYNENLLGYANVVSDSGFINTLNKVNLAIEQFDEGEKLLLISKLNKNNKKHYEN